MRLLFQFMVFVFVLVILFGVVSSVFNNVYSTSPAESIAPIERRLGETEDKLQQLRVDLYQLRREHEAMASIIQEKWPEAGLVVLRHDAED